MAGTNSETNTGAATQPTADQQAANILAEMGVKTAETTKSDEAATPNDEATASDATTGTDDTPTDGTDDVDDSDLADLMKDEDGDDDRDNGDDDPEDGDDEADNDLPELDAELAKNPALAKRWEEQQKGLQKLIDRNKKTGEEHKNLISWADALGNPETAADAYRQLGQHLSQHLGLDLTALMGTSTDAPDTDGDGEDYEKAGFDSPGELKAYQRAKRESDAKITELERKLEAMLQPTKAETERLAKERAAKEAEANFAKKMKVVAPRVIEKLKQHDKGWTVTEEMVAEAIKNLPQLAQEPTKAVRKWFSDERAKHYASLGGRQSVPDMTGGAPPTGNPKRPENQSADDILRSLGINA